MLHILEYSIGMRCAAAAIPGPSDVERVRLSCHPQLSFRPASAHSRLVSLRSSNDHFHNMNSSICRLLKPWRTIGHRILFSASTRYCGIQSHPNANANIARLDKHSSNIPPFIHLQQVHQASKHYSPDSSSSSYPPSTHCLSSQARLLSSLSPSPLPPLWLSRRSSPRVART